MLWFPVKKIRKQFKLLLLLVLLTFAVWFTYLHISLVRQGKALRLHFAYGRGLGCMGEAHIEIWLQPVLRRLQLVNGEK
ncbi:hypothetical protein JRQ81_000229 [Phrynocephalus forsythii]|uniref:Uncharacterized protein n=1 Tax=Phrynocephalus forsythii TaxID=171643 RepID=A0A9Q1B7V5_9SAUR|nr:hypothetical protein JRQ81_000229 [Phrynocephalus forsythii]